MDDQARLRFAGVDGLENPVKRNDDEIDFVRRQLQPELQRQKSAGHGPGTAIFVRASSARLSGFLATSIGP